MFLDLPLFAAVIAGRRLFAGFPGRALRRNQPFWSTSSECC